MTVTTCRAAEDRCGRPPLPTCCGTPPPRSTCATTVAHRCCSSPAAPTTPYPRRWSRKPPRATADPGPSPTTGSSRDGPTSRSASQVGRRSPTTPWTGRPAAPRAKRSSRNRPAANHGRRNDGKIGSAARAGDRHGDGAGLPRTQRCRAAGRWSFVLLPRSSRPACLSPSCVPAVIPLAAPDNAGFTDRRYWAVVGFEAAALFGGLIVIKAVLGRPDMAVAWIAVVVGAHFFALARVWPTRSFHVLATVMVILGVSGLVL